MGGLMLILFVIRFFVFRLYESPKYLMGRGRDAEAVSVVHKIAAYNGTTSHLTLEALQAVERREKGDIEGKAVTMDTSALGAVKRTVDKFGWEHGTPLFRTRQLALSTSLLIVVWGTCSIFLPRPLIYSATALIGLAFPLYA